MLPCQSCCLSGVPSDCEYEATDEDRGFLSQARTIEQLRTELDQLKRRQTIMENAFNSNSLQRPAFDFKKTATHIATEDLRAVVSAIASAPVEGVVRVVSQIRSGTALDMIAASVKENASEDKSMQAAAETQKVCYNGTRVPGDKLQMNML